jgi:type IX secretion system PorP/SprF family membrane protein
MDTLFPPNSMRKILLLSALLPIFCTSALAQIPVTQEAVYASYPFMPLSINPAYAGSREVLTANILMRSRGLLVPSAPTPSQFFSFDTPVAHDRGGVGVVAFNDPTDSFGNSLGIYGMYAHRFTIDATTFLSVGGQLGVTQSREGALALVPANKLNVGLGLYARSTDWYAGLSSPYLTDNGGFFGDSKPIFLNGGYVFHLNEDMSLRAGALVKTFLAGFYSGKIMVDLNATWWIQNRYGIGLWYMNSGSEVAERGILGSVEVQLSDFLRLGYAFDFTAPRANSNTAGGISPSTVNGLHQILLRFETDFGRRKLAEKRFF